MAKFYFTFTNNSSLAGCFTVIEAESMLAARKKMFESQYGNFWGFSYSEQEYELQLKKYRLKEVEFGTPCVREESE